MCMVVLRNIATSTLYDAGFLLSETFFLVNISAYVKKKFKKQSVAIYYYNASNIRQNGYNNECDYEYSENDKIGIEKEDETPRLSGNSFAASDWLLTGLLIEFTLN